MTLKSKLAPTSKTGKVPRKRKTPVKAKPKPEEIAKKLPRFPEASRKAAEAIAEANTNAPLKRSKYPAASARAAAYIKAMGEENEARKARSKYLNRVHVTPGEDTADGVAILENGQFHQDRSDE